MVDHLALANVAETFDLGLAAFAWAFVLVESLNKRVDVPALKARLDVCDAQVMAAVISGVEIDVLPYLGGGTTDFQIDETGATTPDGDGRSLLVLSEAAKSALARSLRKFEIRLYQMYQIRRLPRQVLRLNGQVFWCIFAVAISTSVGALLENVVPGLPVWMNVSAIVVPVCCAALAIIFAVLRHLKVQCAEENIIDTSS